MAHLSSFIAPWPETLEVKHQRSLDLVTRTLTDQWKMRLTREWRTGDAFDGTHVHRTTWRKMSTMPAVFYLPLNGPAADCRVAEIGLVTKPANISCVCRQSNCLSGGPTYRAVIKQVLWTFFMRSYDVDSSSQLVILNNLYTLSLNRTEIKTRFEEQRHHAKHRLAL